MITTGQHKCLKRRRREFMVGYNHVWTTFRHGIWRRIGNKIICYSNQRTIPSEFIAKKPAKVKDGMEFASYGSFSVKGAYYR